MDKKQLEILTNIIGAVESGGQVYGKRRYEAYAGKGANSANEKTCTLGWAQNYGNEARKLCQMILKEDPGAFRGADTAGIESRLSQDWEAIGWNPSATEKAALIAIITTPSGKKCQDELFEQLMETYIKQAVAYGVNTVPDQMMWCEIEHLGGLTPTKRIFGRAAKPYTPDSIYASLILDQQDTSNNNQVGDKMYQSRHQCCVKWIKQYVGEEKESAGMTENELRQMVANNMRGWIGLKRSDRSHMVIINLYNSCLPLARGYKVQPTDDYCATGASAAGIKAGLTDIIPRECSCGYMIQLFQKMGRWIENDAYIPDTGDFVFYYWKDGMNYATTDCTGWPDHVGIVLEDTECLTMHPKQPAKETVLILERTPERLQADQHPEESIRLRSGWEKSHRTMFRLRPGQAAPQASSPGRYWGQEIWWIFAIRSRTTAAMIGIIS